MQLFILESIVDGFGPHEVDLATRFNQAPWDESGFHLKDY